MKVKNIEYLSVLLIKMTFDLMKLLAVATVWFNSLQKLDHSIVYYFFSYFSVACQHLW